MTKLIIKGQDNYSNTFVYDENGNDVSIEYQQIRIDIDAGEINIIEIKSGYNNDVFHINNIEIIVNYNENDNDN